MGLNKGGFFSISGIVTVSVSKQDAINCNNACFCYLYMGSLFFIEFWRFFLIKYFFLSGKMLIVIMQHIIFPPFDAFEFIELRASSISWVLTNYAISYGVRDSQPKRVKQNTVSTLDLICMCSTSTCQHAVIVSSAELSFALYYDFEFLWVFFPSVLIYIIGLFISKYKCIYYVFHQFWST